MTVAQLVWPRLDVQTAPRLSMFSLLHPSAFAVRLPRFIRSMNRDHTRHRLDEIALALYIVRHTLPLACCQSKAIRLIEDGQPLDAPISS